MERYVTVLGESVAEYTEKRSRFIATVRHCETEADALAFIDEMKSKYWDARHNVYAYSVGGHGRFSDDGEPHGTAGKPVYDVITGDGITNLAVVVTRYFGGVLLGTGGLVRAYSKATKDAMLSAQKAEMIPCTLFSTVCEYTDHNKLLNIIETAGGVIENTEFTDKVKIEYSLRDGDCEVYLKKLSESFSARLTAEEIGQKTSGFPIN
ncbi:MAG: YigZ family protein [Ruminococcaceae bacterium]|nr:YigZ family protein [Oscillospiraceae bacterium]